MMCKSCGPLEDRCSPEYITHSSCELETRAGGCSIFIPVANLSALVDGGRLLSRTISPQQPEAAAISSSRSSSVLSAAFIQQTRATRDVCHCFSEVFST